MCVSGGAGLRDRVLPVVAVLSFAAAGGGACGTAGLPVQAPLCGATAEEPGCEEGAEGCPEWLALLRVDHREREAEAALRSRCELCGTQGECRLLEEVLRASGREAEMEGVWRANCDRGCSFDCVSLLSVLQAAGRTDEAAEVRRRMCALEPVLCAPDTPSAP
jgi:hypothetical protein